MTLSIGKCQFFMQKENWEKLLYEVSPKGGFFFFKKTVATEKQRVYTYIIF